MIETFFRFFMSNTGLMVITLLDDIEQWYFDCDTNKFAKEPYYLMHKEYPNLKIWCANGFWFCNINGKWLNLADKCVIWKRIKPYYMIKVLEMSVKHCGTINQLFQKIK